MNSPIDLNEERDISDAILVESFSVVSGLIAGEDYDGEEAVMGGIVLTFTGTVDGGDEQHTASVIIPIDQWPNVENIVVRSIVAHYDSIENAADAVRTVADIGGKDS